MALLQPRPGTGALGDGNSNVSRKALFWHGASLPSPDGRGLGRGGRVVWYPFVMLRDTVRTARTPKVSFARHLRKDQTPGEKVLWNKLRANRFRGFKFRRQVPIGPYVVDFLCVEKKLIIEIDGDSHYEQGAHERDKKRERYLQTHRFNIIRFGNRQTCASIDDVLAEIARVLGCLPD